MINSLLDELEDRVGPDELEQIEADIQARDIIFMLRELAEHAKETAEGQHTIADFAKHYCLTPNN